MNNWVYDSFNDVLQFLINKQNVTDDTGFVLVYNEDSKIRYTKTLQIYIQNQVNLIESLSKDELNIHNIDLQDQRNILYVMQSEYKKLTNE